MSATHLGIDLGTSEVKVVLVGDDDRVVATAARRLGLQRPQPGWSEQNPDDWWRAAEDCLDELAAAHGATMASVRGIGLSGQMHGAVVLDRGDRPVRPAILWNDSRSEAECRELERRCPESRTITGNLAMPGFTAPKLLWLANHEPQSFRALDCVMLPKDYLRLRLSGGRVGDISDAAGTLWLDVERRRWSEAMLSATGLALRHMPALVEGSAPSGELLPALGARWGLPRGVILAGGAADNAAGAVGMGCVQPGQGLLSLGTSGTVLIASDRFRPNTDDAVHNFCHAVPDRWYQMSVSLSATACLDWAATLFGTTAPALLERAAGVDPRRAPLFLPYLAGERTPHNDAHARGVFFGLAADHDSAHLGYAVAEGVAFALADGQAALMRAGADATELALVGGGSRSRFWAGLLAASLQRTLVRPAGADVGAALGAARLSRLASGGGTVEAVCTAPAILDRIEPQQALVEMLQPRLETFRMLYAGLKPAFRKIAG